MKWAILSVIPAYAIGNIAFSVIVARMAGHDIYTEGSGNPGASNVARIAGWRWGVLAMALDILKGLIPTAIALIVFNDGLTTEQTRIVAYLVGIASIFGHVFPVGRKGGKGIATGGGVALALYPVAGIVAILVWAVVMKISKLPVMASIIAAGVLPIWVAIDNDYYLWEWIVVTSLFCFVVIRHIPNFRRLIRREESGVTKHGREQHQEDSQD